MDYIKYEHYFDKTPEALINWLWEETFRQPDSIVSEFKSHHPDALNATYRVVMGVELVPSDSEEPVTVPNAIEFTMLPMDNETKVTAKCKTGKLEINEGAATIDFQPAVDFFESLWTKMPQEIGGRPVVTGQATLETAEAEAEMYEPDEERRKDGRPSEGEVMPEPTLSKDIPYDHQDFWTFMLRLIRDTPPGGYETSKGVRLRFKELERLGHREIHTSWEISASFSDKQEKGYAHIEAYPRHGNPAEKLARLNELLRTHEDDERYAAGIKAFPRPDETHLDYFDGQRADPTDKASYEPVGEWAFGWVLDYLKAQAETGEADEEQESDPKSYDVFLSHNSKDKPAVEKLAHQLIKEGIRPWLDKWNLIPGEPWQEAIEEALDTCQTAAVFLGPAGIGPWENEEMRSALEDRVRDKSHRVIPVLLPGAPEPRERPLPRFLRRLTWVDFRSGLDDADAFHRLVSGIKGVKPGP